MPRLLSLFRPVATALSLAAFSAAACAQDATAAPPSQDPAPIVHHYAPNQRAAQPPLGLTSPAPGIWVRSAPGSDVKTVSSAADTIELRVDVGVANVTLHHPKENAQILVDLGSGQVSLLKDGTYTFNAATNTFRVLEGEAAAFPAADPKAKPLTVKEDHAVVFGAGAGSGALHATSFAPYRAGPDILPPAPGTHEPGYRPSPYSYGRYGAYGPYGDGFYPYAYGPYSAFDYGYGFGPWGYPFGFGPGIGVGFGYGFGYGFGGYRFRR